MCEIMPEGMLAGLYVSDPCKWATHILPPCYDLVVCQGAPALQRQTFWKIKLDSAFLLGTFVLVWATFRRWGRIASHLTFVWASKCKVDHLIPEAKCGNFTLVKLTSGADYLSGCLRALMQGFNLWFTEGLQLDCHSLCVPDNIFCGIIASAEHF